MTQPTQAPLSRSSIQEAHALIKPHVHLTPVTTSQTLSNLASSPRDLSGTRFEGRTPAKPKVRLWFKCENLQRIGAFKVRGAFHAVERLVRDKEWVEGGGKEKGVVTHSSGTFVFFVCFLLFSLFLFIYKSKPMAVCVRLHKRLLEENCTGWLG
jgi:threonine dehydratase